MTMGRHGACRFVMAFFPIAKPAMLKSQDKSLQRNIMMRVVLAVAQQREGTVMPAKRAGIDERPSYDFGRVCCNRYIMSTW
jgi:hypothetical protein